MPEMNDDRPDAELDTSGLSCPLPVLKARKRLRDLPAGARLRVLATDRDSLQDFQVFCEEAGHRLLEQKQEGERIVHLLQKGG